MRYQLFQVKDECIVDHGFRPFDPVRPLSRQAYHQTYAGDVLGEGWPDEIYCENLYRRFNLNHPTDFRSYSMSMGDVVVLEGERAYYCDTLGFKRLEAWS